MHFLISATNVTLSELRRGAQVVFVSAREAVASRLFMAPGRDMSCEARPASPSNTQGPASLRGVRGPSWGAFPLL